MGKGEATRAKRLPLHLRAGPPLLALLLVAQFAGRAELSARHKSPTYDETIHLHYGLLLAREGPTFLAGDHPYPMSMLLVAPLLLAEPAPDQLVRDRRGVMAPDAPELRVMEDPRNLRPARRVNIALASLALLLLGWLVARRAGAAVGVTFVALGALDPSWLAHARLITLDTVHGLAVALAAFALVAARGPRWGWPLFGAALAFAVALGSKLSGLLLAPAALLVLALPGADACGRMLPRAIGRAGLATALGLLLYLLVFELHALVGVAQLADGPQHLLAAFERFVEVRHAHRGAYLLGHYFPRGTFAFYPVLLLAKVPLGMLVLLVLPALTRAGRSQLRRHGALWIVPATFLLAAIVSRVAFGIRHLTPVMPFLWLLGALGLAGLGRRARSVVTIGCFSLLIVEVSVAHPDYLPYTNALFGGRDAAHHVAVDSASDWGQDLPALAAYLRRNAPAGGEPHLAYFGSADPRRYGIHAVWRPCGTLGRSPWRDDRRAACGDGAALLAISATCLHGMTEFRDRDDCYDWLRARPPDMVIGGSILVYRGVEGSPR